MKDFLKGLPVGLAAGVVLSLVLWKSVIAGRLAEPGRAGTETGTAGSAAGQGTPEGREAAALKAEIDRLKA
ncbi:MAG: hypothetical protein HUU15_06225, partial [Candidatus Brocadiae bacterium]|nr:hypothetical protein [Candidatus Brocadiia bacterium]